MYGSDNKPIPMLQVVSKKPMMSVILHFNTLRNVRNADVLTADARSHPGGFHTVNLFT